jgi:hypothetical protein
MKIKMLTRSTDSATRDSKQGVFKVSSNPDPLLHPHERALEVSAPATSHRCCITAWRAV